MAVTLRPFTETEADYALAADFHRFTRPEQPTDAASVRAHFASHFANCATGRFIVERGGDPVGYAVWFEDWWSRIPGRVSVRLFISPTDPDLADAFRLVNADARAQGAKEILGVSRSDQPLVSAALAAEGFNEVERMQFSDLLILVLTYCFKIFVPS